MKDFMGMMKAAQEMQGRMQEFQGRLDDISVEGRSGGGLLTVTAPLPAHMRETWKFLGFAEADEPDPFAGLAPPR